MRILILAIVLLALTNISNNAYSNVQQGGGFDETIGVLPIQR